MKKKQKQWNTGFPSDLKEILGDFLEKYPEYKNPTNFLQFAGLKMIRDIDPQILEKATERLKKESQTQESNNPA